MNPVFGVQVVEVLEQAHRDVKKVRLGRLDLNRCADVLRESH